MGIKIELSSIDKRRLNAATDAIAKLRDDPINCPDICWRKSDVGSAACTCQTLALAALAAVRKVNRAARKKAAAR